MPSPRLPTLLPALLTLALAATGCRTVQGTVGNIIGSVAVDHTVPYVLASDDWGLACETGQSLQNFVGSFNRVSDPMDRVEIPTLLLAGMCAESQSWDHELAQLAAVRDGRTAAATDARVLEKRLRGVAARRYLASFRHGEAVFGSWSGTCPRFHHPEDQNLYALSLLAVLNAALSDKASSGLGNVPLDLVANAARASECLDDAALHGIPTALRAAVWTVIPGTVPEGVDAWVLLEQAAQRGEAAGIRLARAVQVEALAGAGKEAEVRRAITASMATVERVPRDSRYRLLDVHAQAMLLQMSDRLWMREVGHRTPPRALGQWPQASRSAGKEEADLLEGL